MKTVEQLKADVERRLSNTWASSVTAFAQNQHATSPQHPGASPAAWPHAFPLGQRTSADLAKDFATVAAWANTWRTWSQAQSTTLRARSRVVHGTEQEIPTHLIIADIDHAARLCGPTWLRRLERGRQRATVLADQFPHLVGSGLLPATVAAVDDMGEIDFDLLCRAGTWFTKRDATGLTPRQVPIEGLHAKWLNHRQGLVQRLSARDAWACCHPIRPESTSPTSTPHTVPPVGASTTRSPSATGCCRPTSPEW